MTKYHFRVILLAIFVISGDITIGAALHSHQLAHEDYKPSDIAKGHIRLMAQEAAEQFIQHLLKAGITAKQRHLSTLLNYDIEKDAAPYRPTGKPLRFLVSYHYRKDGRLPYYKLDVFTDSWIAEKTSVLGVAGSTDTENLYVICMATVLNESNIISLHVLDRDRSRLMSALDVIRPIFALEPISPFRWEPKADSDALAELLERLKISSAAPDASVTTSALALVERIVATATDIKETDE